MKTLMWHASALKSIADRANNKDDFDLVLSTLMEAILEKATAGQYCLGLFLETRRSYTLLILEDTPMKITNLHLPDLGDKLRDLGYAVTYYHLGTKTNVLTEDSVYTMEILWE